MDCQVIGQLHPVNGSPIIEARKCRLKFHFNVYLDRCEPVEFRVHPDEIKQYPAEIDRLPVVADPNGTVRRGFIFLCCPDPEEVPELEAA